MWVSGANTMRTKKWLRLVISGILGLTIAGVLLSAYIEKPALVEATDFMLETQTENLSLAQLRGKVVYLDFWASWCGPCRASFPWMNEMHRKYAKDGLVIIAVNLDKVPGQRDKFLQEFPADFIIAFDQQAKTANDYNISVMPTSILISRQGLILDQHVGFSEKKIDQYERTLKKAL